jgi:hypothetical protein
MRPNPSERSHILDCDAARLPQWRLTCASLRAWGRSGGVEVDVEEAEGGLWGKCLKGQGVESGVGLQFVHGRI